MQRTRIDWVAEQSKLLRGIAEEFTRTQPFAGLTIGTGIHLEAKTVALLLTLQAGGAKLVSTGNLNTTQADAVGLESIAFPAISTGIYGFPPEEAAPVAHAAITAFMPTNLKRCLLVYRSEESAAPARAAAAVARQ
jgi:O-acetyl-ADP-ribose deacetylase (regulator of RNase III)